MPFGIFSWNMNPPHTHHSGIQVQSKHSISIHLAGGRGEWGFFMFYYYCKQIVHSVLFETEGVSDLRICILSNQVTCTPTICLQGPETTAKTEKKALPDPKAVQVAVDHFLFLIRQDLSLAGLHPHRHCEKMASW